MDHVVEGIGDLGNTCYLKTVYSKPCGRINLFVAVFLVSEIATRNQETAECRKVCWSLYLALRRPRTQCSTTQSQVL